MLARAGGGQVILARIAAVTLLAAATVMCAKALSCAGENRGLALAFAALVLAMIAKRLIEVIA